MKQIVLFLVLSTLAVAFGIRINKNYAFGALSERDQILAGLTGSTTLEDIQKAFQEVFQSSDIDQVLQQVSQVTNQKDAVSFLSWCVEITHKPNIKEASKVFQDTTTQNLTLIELLKQTAAECKRDLKDFYVQLIRQTSADSFGVMFNALKDVTGLQDIFDMLKIGEGSTDLDLIEIHEIEFKATRTKTLQEYAAVLCNATSTSNILQAYAVIKATSDDITNADILEIFNIIGTFEVNSWAEFVEVITKYTGTSDFVSAMKAVKKATGENNSVDALKHIQQGLPPAAQ